MSRKLIVLACLLAAVNARSSLDSNFNISTLTSRIIGGRDAKPGEFPHQISLQLTWPQQGLRYAHFCSGSILNEQWILTAAQCLVPVQSADPNMVFTIKAGKHDLSKLNEEFEQRLHIKTFFIHEEYDKNAALGISPYDIGLIKVDKTLQLNKRVAAIALPKKDSEPTGKVVLSGWGATSPNSSSPEMPAILQTVDLPIVDRVNCNKAIAKVYKEKGIELPYDLVDDTNVCTGPLTGSKSICSGDSGGPLISKGWFGSAELVGVVSWTMVPCGRKGAPSVHTRTGFFVDWIEKTIASN